MQAIPVYVFTGFLEAGKTKFIQETLEDPRFNDGERTLLLTADLEENGQKKMVELHGDALDADIIKYPHHGIEELLPEYQA